MSKGVNKVILVGACGNDPEVRYSQSGTAFASLSIATNESWKDKQTGEKQERTEWHRLVFSARLAEVVGEYVRKGMTIYVEGKLSTRKWQNKEGVDQYTTEIKCFEMQMLGGNQQGNNAQPQQGYNQAPQQRQQPAQGYQPRQAPQQGHGGYDDDLPI